jgi:hypothetical protein
MILQALEGYYRRLDEEGDAAPEGFTKKEIPFLIVLDESGGFISLEDTRSPVGRKMLGRMFLVPEERVRSGSKAWQAANLLWDHYGYVLACPKSDESAIFLNQVNSHPFSPIRHGLTVKKYPDAILHLGLEGSTALFAETMLFVTTSRMAVLPPERGMQMTERKREKSLPTSKVLAL